MEGKTKHIKGKHGLIIREIEEGSKRKIVVVWDDESQGCFFSRAVKKIRPEIEDDPPDNVDAEMNIDNHHNQPLGDDEEDDNLSESSTRSEPSVDGSSDNEVDPEDGLPCTGAFSFYCVCNPWPTAILKRWRNIRTIYVLFSTLRPTLDYDIT